jgi:hypothetical protein
MCGPAARLRRAGGNTASDPSNPTHVNALIDGENEAAPGAETAGGKSSTSTVDQEG